MSNVFTEAMFTIPLWRLKTNNFDYKKNQLQTLFNKHQEKQNEIAVGDFTTNRYETNDIVKSFSEIMVEELQAITQEVKTDLSIKEVWSVSYKRNGFHPIHNHGSTGLSGILYLDFPQGVPPTSFVQPWNNIFTDNSVYCTPQVREGDIVVVPSNIFHFTQPNRTDKLKRTISWDMAIHTDTKIT